MRERLAGIIPMNDGFAFMHRNYYEEVCLPRLRLCSRSRGYARRLQVPRLQGRRFQVQGHGDQQAGG